MWPFQTMRTGWCSLVPQSLNALFLTTLNFKIMIGCMTETSCAVSAAAQLSPLCEWADLDGNLLIANDGFEGMKVIDGKNQE